MAGALGTAVRELRLQLCQRSAGSSGLREFVTKYYPELKKANPQLPILVRECSGIQAQIHGRFAKGREVHWAVDGLSAEQILAKVKDLAKSA